MSDSKLKTVCWFGIFDPLYSRNVVIKKAMQTAGYQLVDCRVSGVGFLKYIKLIYKIIKLRGGYDILYCPFPVGVCVVLGYVFQGRPIVTDALFPSHDAMVNDRKLVSRRSLKAKMYALIDYLTIRLSSCVLADTTSHKSYWNKIYPKTPVIVVPVGADNEEFYPIHNEPSTFVVTFHGSYIPLQGVDKIVHAAKLLEKYPDIKFRFIGKGQEYERIHAMVKGLWLDVEFVSWVDIPTLNEYLNNSSVVLGIFGDTEKSMRVVPNKVFQGLAVRRPVVTMKSPAIDEFFTDDEVIKVTNSPAEIAQAIVSLYESQEKRRSISGAGYQHYIDSYTPSALSNLLYDL